MSIENAYKIKNRNNFCLCCDTIYSSTGKFAVGLVFKKAHKYNQQI